MINNDLTGQRFGKLTVLEFIGKGTDLGYSSRQSYWKVKCDCGNEKIMRYNNILHAKSCGCKLPNIIGQRFGKLTVIKKVENEKPGSYFLVKCDCGHEKIVLGSSLVHGDTTSCGNCSIVEQRFGKLVAIKEIGRDPKNKYQILYLCKCDCGNEKVVRKEYLVQGDCRSCGCDRPHKIEDLRGQKFGTLTVIEQDHRDKNSQVWWKTKCDCGNERVIRHSELLRKGAFPSCGCQTKGIRVGQKFGKLEVLERVLETKGEINGSRREALWKVKCNACGETKILPTQSIKRLGNSSGTCGCYIYTQEFKDKLRKNGKELAKKAQKARKMKALKSNESLCFSFLGVKIDFPNPFKRQVFHSSQEEFKEEE